MNFCAKFIPDLATISEPLRKLTKKDVPFHWGTEQNKAFTELNRRLSSTDTLGYSNKDAKTDASPVGLGVILTQVQNGEEPVICFASRSLTEVERRYPQTERKL